MNDSSPEYLQDSLHDDLSALVPEPPPTGGWGPAVRRRGRSRRAGIATVAVAVVAAGAVWLGATLLGGPSQVATPAPSTPVASVSPQAPIDDDYTGVEAQACADLREDPPMPAGPSGDLPDGATRAWLCGPQAPYPFASQLGPREPLTTGVDRIVAAFNALPATPGEQIACTEVGGLTYAVIVEYADGAVVLNGETVNCQFVGGRRGGGAQFLADLEGFWEEARATAPAFEGPLDLCANRSLEAFRNYSIGYGSFISQERADAVRGVVCSVAADAPGLNAPTVSVPIPPEVLADLANGKVEPFEPGWSFGQSIQPAYVVLVNRFGDPVSYGLGDDGAALVWEENQNAWWRPSDTVADLWAQTLSQVRVKPFYSVPDVCGGYDPATMTGDPAKAVSGIVCAPREALPAKGPELDPALAREIGQRFAAGAAEQWGQMNSANFVVLTDSDGASMRLYWDGTLPGRLVAETGLSWPLPDDLRIELEEYGLSFVPE